jgi:hypothetical protein
MQPTSVASALMCTRWLLSCELCKGHFMCQVEQSWWLWERHKQVGTTPYAMAHRPQYLQG